MWPIQNILDITAASINACMHAVNTRHGRPSLRWDEVDLWQKMKQLSYISPSVSSPTWIEHRTHWLGGQCTNTLQNKIAVLQPQCYGWSAHCYPLQELPSGIVVSGKKVVCTAGRHVDGQVGGHHAFVSDHCAKTIRHSFMKSDTYLGHMLQMCLLGVLFTVRPAPINIGIN